jgi:hypothetical protein
MSVSKNEFLWREWLLGEGRYKGKGPRSRPRPDVGYGDPSKGQENVPPEWWGRLEAFLAKRSDYSEPGRKTPEPPAPTAPAKTGQLTPHFNVREFDCHDGRRVPAVAVPALTKLCRLLEQLRDEFGPAIVLSGYRPRDYNARIGGARFSQHIYELTPASVAADLVFATGTPASWARAAGEHRAGGVGRYDRSGFVHVDNRPDLARWTG